jgi:hypothetical protein
MEAYRVMDMAPSARMRGQRRTVEAAGVNRPGASRPSHTFADFLSVQTLAVGLSSTAPHAPRSDATHTKILDGDELVGAEIARSGSGGVRATVLRTLGGPGRGGGASPSVRKDIGTRGRALTDSTGPAQDELDGTRGTRGRPDGPIPAKTDSAAKTDTNGARATTTQGRLAFREEVGQTPSGLATTGVDKTAAAWVRANQGEMPVDRSQVDLAPSDLPTSTDPPAASAKAATAALAHMQGLFMDSAGVDSAVVTRAGKELAHPAKPAWTGVISSGDDGKDHTRQLGENGRGPRFTVEGIAETKDVSGGNRAKLAWSPTTSVTSSDTDITGIAVRESTAVLVLDHPEMRQHLASMVAQQVDGGITQLKVAVHPEGLGPLVVTVVHRDGLVQVQLQAAHPVTAAWLQQEVGQLTDAMRDVGIPISSLQVVQGTLADGSGDSSGSREQGRQADRRLAAVAAVSDGEPSGGAKPAWTTANQVSVGWPGTQAYTINLRA